MSVQQPLIKARSGEPAPPPPPVLGLVLTSGLYPVLVEGDAVSVSAGFLSGRTSIFFDTGTEQVYARAGLQAASTTVTITYTNYTNWTVEDVYARAGFLSASTTTTIAYTNYTNWPTEDAYARAAFVSATLTVVIQYVSNAMQPEDVYARAAFQSATLT